MSGLQAYTDTSDNHTRIIRLRIGCRKLASNGQFESGSSTIWHSAYIGADVQSAEAQLSRQEACKGNLVAKSLIGSFSNDVHVQSLKLDCTEFEPHFVAPPKFALKAPHFGATVDGTATFSWTESAHVGTYYILFNERDDASVLTIDAVAGTETYQVACQDLSCEVTLPDNLRPPPNSNRTFKRVHWRVGARYRRPNGQALDTYTDIWGFDSK